MTLTGKFLILCSRRRSYPKPVVRERQLLAGSSSTATSLKPVIRPEPATFYLWHDEQAAQLRFSVARCFPGSLPFGCAVAHVDAADEIIGNYLASTNVDGLIPWSELEPVGVDIPETSKAQPYLLRVRARRLA